MENDLKNSAGSNSDAFAASSQESAAKARAARIKKLRSRMGTRCDIGPDDQFVDSSDVSFNDPPNGWNR